jgi:iron(III) transport system ATP-binding protein
MAARVEVRALEHAYGDVRVLDRLEFLLESGRIGCFLGPSGCGKTTLLRCLAGFEDIAAGEIRFNGNAVSRPTVTLPPEQRRVGMVFQDYALFPHLSVARNIAFGLRGWDRRESRSRVADMLALVGLRSHEDAFPHQLSGGQQQRVALARALAPGPDLLLLDEPFSNLDVELRQRLSVEVREIIKEIGATAILVTHDQGEAFALADDVGVMRAGRLEQWAPPYELYHRPASRFVADFVGQGVFLRGIVRDSASVATELGDLDADLPAEVGPGEAVDLLLRPDDVVHDDGSPMRAEVAAKSFRGADFVYTLLLASGTRVLSLVPSHHDHALGERIGIRLAIDHVVAFPAAGEIPGGADRKDALRDAIGR